MRVRYLAVVLLVSATACSPPEAPRQQEVTVFAASSLTRVFTRIGEQFEAEHPDVAVRFTFAGSSDLVAQLQQGAQGDVLATADQATMGRAEAAGLVEPGPQPFARNSLAIAVPAGNPAGVAGFPDLARPGVRVVVCAVQVPCGAATARVEQKSGVHLQPASEESSAGAVLAKVAAGEADAGVVYATDVQAGGEVTGIAIPAADNAVTTYPIGVLAGTARPAAARQFTEWVLGPEGQEALADAGFRGP